MRFLLDGKPLVLFFNEMQFPAVDPKQKAASWITRMTIPRGGVHSVAGSPDGDASWVAEGCAWGPAQ
jgi:hypothetical protein